MGQGMPGMMPPRMGPGPGGAPPGMPPQLANMIQGFMRPPGGVPGAPQPGA